MTPNKLLTAERLSALVDGHLQGGDLAQALQACEQDAELMDRWRDYHLIGDVLRGVPLSPGADEARFLARLRTSLAEAPLGMPPDDAVASAPHRIRIHSEAANEPRFRWRWAAGFASVALLAGLTWSLLGDQGAQEEGLASADAPVLVAGPQGVMIRDAALEELMEAHRQQVGASVLPMPSGFLRNATFESTPATLPRAGLSPAR